MLPVGLGQKRGPDPSSWLGQLSFTLKEYHQLSFTLNEYHQLSFTLNALGLSRMTTDCDATILVNYPQIELKEKELLFGNTYPE